MANPLFDACDAFWRESALEALKNFIAVPSVSTGFDPDWEAKGFLQKACEVSVAWAKNVFPEAIFEIHTEKGRTPVVTFEIPASEGASDAAVGFYGHLDKLPGFEGWSDGIDAFTPRIHDGKPFGRGGADDGYSFYLTICAIKAIEDARLAHPRIVGIFETREECGCADMPYWMAKLHDQFGKVASQFVLDSDCCKYDGVYLTTSLRGL
ncbi:MAG TPA: peptidase, partial [Sutterella sp.]|nr:peptidase [Sutterella sp.]